jgi:hypothetical protein
MMIPVRENRSEADAVSEFLTEIRLQYQTPGKIGKHDFAVRPRACATYNLCGICPSASLKRDRFSSNEAVVG